MRRLLTTLALFLSPLSAFATLGAATAWDVRTTGVDTNGGAFDSGVGSPGTDESQGAGTAITITLTGTTTGTGSPVFSSTTHGPGNFVHIASGAGCTTGWFEILSQSAGTATFDHAMGTAANVCVGTIGGSLLTIAQANTNSVSSNTIWIKSGTYTQTATVAISLASLTFSGYATTHGDNGTKPLITTSTNSTDLFTTSSITTGTIAWIDLSFSNTAATRGNGMVAIGGHANTSLWVIKSDVFDGFVTALNSDNAGAHWTVGNAAILQTEIKNCTGNGTSFYTFGGSMVLLTVDGSYFHNNAGDGVNADGGGTPFVLLVRSTFAANGGNGAKLGSFGTMLVSNSTFAGNAGDGLLVDPNAGTYGPLITNSIFYGNGNRGVNSPAPALSMLPSHNNGFGANTGGNTSFTNMTIDFSLTANPFTNSGSGDYSLNSTAGGGAALKGVGYPGVFPGGTSTGSLDIGAVQSAGGGGSAASNYGVSN